MTIGPRRLADTQAATRSRGDAHEARAHLFEAAAALGRALGNPDTRAGWEPLRDILLAGFESGGLRPGTDPEALRRAAGQLAEVALTGHEGNERR